jgi:hypothetical protein
MFLMAFDPSKQHSPLFLLKGLDLPNFMTCQRLSEACVKEHTQFPRHCPMHPSRPVKPCICQCASVPFVFFPSTPSLTSPFVPPRVGT